MDDLPDERPHCPFCASGGGMNLVYFETHAMLQAHLRYSHREQVSTAGGRGPDSAHDREWDEEEFVAFVRSMEDYEPLDL